MTARFPARLNIQLIPSMSGFRASRFRTLFFSEVSPSPYFYVSPRPSAAPVALGLPVSSLVKLRVDLGVNSGSLSSRDDYVIFLFGIMKLSDFKSRRYEHQMQILGILSVCWYFYFSRHMRSYLAYRKKRRITSF